MDYLKTFAWRFIRTALAVALAQFFILKPNLSNTKEVAIAFVSAFIVSLAKVLRDYLVEEDKNSPFKYLPL